MKLFIMRHSDRSHQQGVNEEYQSLTDTGRNKVINVTNSIIEFLAGIKINHRFSWK